MGRSYKGRVNQDEKNLMTDAAWFDIPTYRQCVLGCMHTHICMFVCNLPCETSWAKDSEANKARNMLRKYQYGSLSFNMLSIIKLVKNASMADPGILARP